MLIKGKQHAPYNKGGQRDFRGSIREGYRP